MRSILMSAALSLLMWQSLFAQLAIRAETLYTMAGPPIADGVVLIRDEKIEAVGAASRVSIPEGYRTLRAAIVTPGLIDSRTVVGLAGYLNQPHDQDQLERSGAIQPELRAIDAYNARERLVEYLREHGVTTVHTGHAPGALISGQTMIAKTRGATLEEAVVVPEAMVAATLATAARQTDGRSPGTRAKMVAMLRGEFYKAQEYARQGGREDLSTRPDPDLRLETLARVLSHELPLLVTAHRVTDIMSALRLAEEFKLRLILDGGAESYLVIPQLLSAGVPVLLHPTMLRAVGDAENLSFETAARLREEGVLVALQSGYESYVPRTRVVLFEAGVAAAHGLPFEEALSAITRAAAEILGIQDRVGTLEVGKDGDLVLFDGDPFEYLTRVVGVVIDGEIQFAPEE